MSIRLNDWLNMINTYFNPYNQDVKKENLNILMYANGSTWSTTGYAQSIESFFDYNALLATPEPSLTPAVTDQPMETPLPPEGGSSTEVPQPTAEPAPPTQAPAAPPLEQAPSAEDPTAPPAAPEPPPAAPEPPPADTPPSGVEESTEG